MIREVAAPSGRQYTVRSDAFALALAKEASSVFTQLPDDNPLVGYLGDEMAASQDALRLGSTAALAGEPIAALLFAHFGVETTIRLSWIIGDGPDEEKVRTRLKRLEKLELRQLSNASDAISEASVLGPLVENRSELQQIVGSIPEPPAPRSLREMAAEAGWEWLYALHRFCSSALHPGIGARAGIAASVEPKELLHVLYYSFSATVMSAAGIASAVFPKFEVLELRLNAATLAHAGNP